MATLIVYPALNYNSFVSVSDADIIASGYLNYTAWSALTVDEQTAYLMSAFRAMMGLPGFTPPSVADYRAYWDCGDTYLCAEDFYGGAEGFTKTVVVRETSTVVMPTCLSEAQVQIALQDLQFGFSTGEVNRQEIKSEKAGPVETEYYASASGYIVPLVIPMSARPCLAYYGYHPTDSDITGIATIRKYR